MMHPFIAALALFSLLVAALYVIAASYGPQPVRESLSRIAAADCMAVIAGGVGIIVLVLL